MCKFLSAIGLKNGDIICEPSIESHELLVEANSLNDEGSKLRNWVRIEYYPDDDKDLADISKYKLHIDDSHFDWIDGIKDKWVRKLNVRLKKIIISEDRVFLPVGLFILSGEITIQYAGNATIQDAGNATIQYAGYATIQNAGNATIQNAGNATIQYAENATIQYAGCATIQDAGYATIQDAGYATIQYAEYATIQYAGYATIQNAGYATIINKQSAKISK